MTYEQVVKDYCNLLKIGPPSDIDLEIGEDLDKLLKKPCKSLAKQIMIAQIVHWYCQGPMGSNYKWNTDEDNMYTIKVRKIQSNKKVHEIAVRYDISAAWLP